MRNNIAHTPHGAPSIRAPNGYCLLNFGLSLIQLIIPMGMIGELLISGSRSSHQLQFRNPNGPMSNGQKWALGDGLPTIAFLFDKIRPNSILWKLLMNFQPNYSEMPMVHCTNIPERKQKAKARVGRTLLQPWNYATLAPIAIKKTPHRKRGWDCNFWHFNYGCCHNNHNGFTIR